MLSRVRVSAVGVGGVVGGGDATRAPARRTVRDGRGDGRRLLGRARGRSGERRAAVARSAEPARPPPIHPLSHPAPSWAPRSAAHSRVRGETRSRRLRPRDHRPWSRADRGIRRPCPPDGAVAPTDARWTACNLHYTEAFEEERVCCFAGCRSPSSWPFSSPWRRRPDRPATRSFRFRSPSWISTTVCGSSGSTTTAPGSSPSTRSCEPALATRWRRASPVTPTSSST